MRVKLLSIGIQPASAQAGVKASVPPDKTLRVSVTIQNMMETASVYGVGIYIYIGSLSEPTGDIAADHETWLGEAEQTGGVIDDAALAPLEQRTYQIDFPGSDFTAGVKDVAAVVFIVAEPTFWCDELYDPDAIEIQEKPEVVIPAGGVSYEEV